METGMELLKQCGHRLADKHFQKIRKVRRAKRLISDGAALRHIIEFFKV